MKNVTLIAIFCVLCGGNAHAAPLDLGGVIDKYSQSCKPLAEAYLVRAQVTASLFNDGSYFNASRVLSGMREAIMELLQHDDCTLADGVYTLEISEYLSSLDNQVYCSLRLVDTKVSFNAAFDAVDKNEFKAALQHLTDVQWTMADIEKHQMCKDSGEDIQGHIATLKTTAKDMIANLEDIVDVAE